MLGRPSKQTVQLYLCDCNNRNCDLEEVSSSVPEQPVTPAAPEKPVIKVKSFATVPEEDTTALAKSVENKVCSLNF